MTAVLIIIAVIAVLLLVIAFLRVHIVAGYADRLVLYYQVGPVRIDLIEGDWISEDLTDHKKRDKWEQKQKKQIQKGKKKPRRFRYSKEDISELVRTVKDLLVGIWKYVRKYAKIESFRLRVLVASDDAAKTACRYGEVNAAMAQLVSVLDLIPEKQKNENKMHLEAECDFVAEQMEVDVELELTLFVWQALLTRSWYGKEIQKLWALMMKDFTPEERKQ